ncbi:hypothetical protein [Halobacillus salinus]|uniref:DUF3006 domain-containing protein n=1 Tax=Halobacillus salinus TaxID=192814 RepID=A0A4Z0H0M9_9BACI|nr:hypothetical protein [Halobacillus salinus]TGB03968.1 hypothetical protein E4663_02880 [Halobacillus salinus]
MNKYRLDRFEGTYAILIQEHPYHNELSVLKERLVAIAQPGDELYIDFDAIGNLKNIEVVKADKMEKA